MRTPQLFLNKVGHFLVDRCKDLGYVPLITKDVPINRCFSVQPSQDAVFVKLFGHFNTSINTVHCRFAVLDPENLENLGALDEENLCLGFAEKYLLVASLFELSHKDLLQLANESNTLQDLYKKWVEC